MSCVLAAVMVIGLLGGCQAGTTATTAGTSASTASLSTTSGASAKKFVALSISNTQNDFMAAMVSGLKEKFEAEGIRFESASADADSTKQIQQIENFITMKPDVIMELAVEPTALTDVNKKAMAQGIKIFDFTTNTGADTVYYGADEPTIGKEIAKIASKWIDTTFPNAADGSVNAVLFKYYSSSDGKKRSDGMDALSTLNKKVKVTKTLEVENTTSACQKAVENLFQTNPETKVILCYNGAMAAGVNTYVMSPNSGVKDVSRFGVFGSEITAEFANDIKLSASNKAVFRGSVQIGGTIPEVIGMAHDIMAKMLNNNYEKVYYGQMTDIDTSNIDAVLKTFSSSSSK